MALTQVDQGLLGTYAQYTGFKNRIINGQMQIDQRNAGASVTPADGQYLTDRWLYSAFQASKVTAQQNQGSVTPPVGFVNYLGITSSSAYSVPAGEYYTVSQRIEGLNIADLAWGTVNAKTVTLSFQVYSSLTGTFGGALRNSAGTQSYPFTYTISSANTWTSISITIAGSTTGTWLTTNGIGINLTFGLGAGSTYSGTAGSWASANYVSATGATSVVGTNGATFYITGVQLEKGSTATSFDYRPYGTELSLCYRYFFRVDSKSGVYTNFSNGQVRSGSSVDIYCQHPVTMRTAPTFSNSGVSSLFFVSGGSVGSPTSIAMGYGSPFISSLNGVPPAGFTTGYACGLVSANTLNAFLDFSAEL